MASIVCMWEQGQTDTSCICYQGEVMHRSWVIGSRSPNGQENLVCLEYMYICTRWLQLCPQLHVWGARLNWHQLLLPVVTYILTWTVYVTTFAFKMTSYIGHRSGVIGHCVRGSFGIPELSAMHLLSNATTLANLHIRSGLWARVCHFQCKNYIYNLIFSPVV